MRKTRFVFVALLLVLGATALVSPRPGPLPSRRRSRRRGSTSGRTTTAAGRRRTTRAVSPSRRRSASKVQTTYKENVPEGPQTCQVIESLVRDGNKIIFATSFGFQNCMLSEAKKHPDVYFEQATGTLQAKNMAEYFGAGEDSIYLAGMAAGRRRRRT